MPVGVGSVLVLVAAAMLLLGVGQVRESRAYEAAPACPPGAPRSDACTTAVAGTVVGTDTEPSGRSQIQVLLVAEDVAEDGAEAVRRLPMDGQGGDRVYETARPGDAVTLTYWRGEIRAVSFGDLRQETHASPANDWRMPLALGLLLAPLGLCLLWSVWWQRQRQRHAAARRVVSWPVAVLTVVVVAVAVVAGVGAVACVIAPDLTAVLLVAAVATPPAVGLGGLFAWGLRRRGREARDRGDPGAPAGVRQPRRVVTDRFPAP
ncbi:hypothetical protein ACTWP5_01175 [Streptomyces sp. 4N509B]|uniref:hypothetical protein n=1 Tax=Streptomyces sp. 4N509B TaxID=3457413 RepID=UPI003FD2AB5B